MSKRRKSNRVKAAGVVESTQRSLQWARTHEYLVEDGEVNDWVYEQVLEQIKDQYKDNPAEILKKKRDLTELIDAAKVHKDTLKTSKIKASWENSRIKIMFANMGYTIDEAAGEIGVDEMELLNPENWDWEKSVFKSGDKSWKFTFASDYDESPWTSIKAAPNIQGRKPRPVRHRKVRNV